MDPFRLCIHVIVKLNQVLEKKFVLVHGGKQAALLGIGCNRDLHLVLPAVTFILIFAISSSQSITLFFFPEEVNLQGE